MRSMHFAQIVVKNHSLKQTWSKQLCGQINQLRAMSRWQSGQAVNCDYERCCMVFATNPRFIYAGEN